LEFIRLHLLEMQGYGATASPAAYQRPNSPARPGANNAYRPDGNSARVTPPSPPPANPPINNQMRYPPQATAATKEFGQLVRTTGNVVGRPLYLLQDSQGNRKCYVVPADGLFFEGYVGRNVTVSSNGQLSYHPELRGYLLTASHVALLGP
jgi:hypothetical protein